MSNSRQAHAIACFVADVLQPIDARRRDAIEEGCSWRVRWSLGEALEARRFLLIGRAVGLFDPNDVDRAFTIYQGLLDEAREVGDLALNVRQQAELYALDEQLNDTDAPAGAIDDFEMRALIRCRGLFQSNVLTSSRLGHGLAAEALARLAFGDPMSCLKPLATFAGSDRAPAGAAEHLLQALGSPGERAAQAMDKLPEAALAASVFHATQYLWTLGFTHEYRGIAVEDELPWSDPFMRLVGHSIGDSLHLAQYWRLDFQRPEFEQHVHEAVELMARILFRFDDTLGRAAPVTDPAGFASDFRAKFERVGLAWKAVFDPVPVYDEGRDGALMA